jgi:hypothetical protein
MEKIQPNSVSQQIDAVTEAALANPAEDTTVKQADGHTMAINNEGYAESNPATGEGIVVSQSGNTTHSLEKEDGRVGLTVSRVGQDFSNYEHGFSFGDPERAKYAQRAAEIVVTKSTESLTKTK